MDYSLINKYLSGKASEVEVKQVFDWIDAAPENRDEFIRYKQIWALTAQSTDNPVKAWSEILVDQIQGKSKVKKLLRVVGYAAAVVLVFGLGMSVRYFVPGKSPVLFSYMASTKVEVPPGQMSNVVLPDGTTVQLNSGSKLVYSGSYNNGQRQVQLEGEAFFDVAKDAEHPFVIQTRLLDFKVYGTSFNVEAYPEEKEVNTTLVEGSLGVLAKSGKELTKLFPGENVLYQEDSKSIVISKVDPGMYTSWKEGIITFRSESLDEIARKIERWYNVEIVIQNPQVANERYMLTVMKYKPIDQILEVLKITSGLNYRIEHRIDKPARIYLE
jgi:ferric-dicitrate binding protein FerR (iron transport regulator)